MFDKSSKYQPKMHISEKMFNIFKTGETKFVDLKMEEPKL